MVTFGYNTDCASISFERAVSAMQASRATHHLIMMDNRSFFWQQGEIDTIKKYCQAVPKATFIVRLYNANEGNWKAYPQASEYQKNWTWAKSALGEYANRVVFDDCVNEPNLAPLTHPDAALYVQRCVKLIEAASASGIKLAIGAFSVGSLQEDILSTTYTPLWNALKQHKQAISWHLYGAIPFEAGELAPLNIVLDARKARTYMKDEKWPMSHLGWLIAESYRVIQICESMGFTPEIYITECIVDNVLGSQPDVKEAWRNKYGLNEFMRDPRGIRTWSKYLAEFFEADKLDFEHGIAKLLQHARKNIFFHPAFKGACLFALNAQWDYGYEGKPNGTHKEAGSNYDRPEYALFRSTLLGIVNTEVFAPNPIPTPPPPSPIPAFPTFPLMVRTTKESFIRAAPNTQGKVLGTIPTEWTEARLSTNFYPNPIDNFNWYSIELGDIVGFVADTLAFQFKAIETPLPKTFTVVWDTVPIEVSEQALDKLIAAKSLELDALKAAKMS